MIEKPIHIIFRQTPENKFTIPLLLNLLEHQNIDRKFPLHVASSLSALQKICHSSKFAILVYSFMSSHLPSVWHEIQEIKSKFGDKIFYLAGGPHPSGAPEATLNMGFDTVICGAGEPVFAHTVQKILDDRKSMKGHIIMGGSITSLDNSLPISRTISLMPPLEIMRGCFYRCGFCQTGHTQKPVYRSLESVGYYLKELITRNYLYRTGFICPSGLEYGSVKPGKPDLSQLESLLDTSKSIGIRHLEYGIFPSEIHPKTLNSEALQLIRKYCRNKKLTLGAQSGSNEILKSLKRGHTIEDIETATTLASDHGFRVVLDFIIGFPGETEANRLETLDWVRFLNNRHMARIQMHYFLPLAGTCFADQNPALPGQKSRDMLDAFYKNGICTNWWRKGLNISWNLVRIRDALKTHFMNG